MCKEIPEVVKTLAGAVSGATRVQNRYWMALIVVSLYVLIPRSPLSSAETVKVSLPFGLGDVAHSWFFATSTLILGVLLIVFCAAQVHLVRVLEFTHEILKTRRSAHLAQSKFDERDMLSALLLPSLSRVAPLAQVIKGKHRFFHNKSDCPQWRLILSGALYVIWKGIAVGVWLAVPALALRSAWLGYRHSPLPATAVDIWEYLPFAMWPLFLCSALAWLIALYYEVRYIFVALPKIASKSEDNG